MTGLRALIANLAGGAQRATIGSGAVTGDVTLKNTINIIVSYVAHRMLTGGTHKLATGIALHSLSLTVASKVVRAAALVAGGSTRVTTVSATETTGVSSTGSRSATRTSSRDSTVALEIHQLLRPCP